MIRRRIKPPNLARRPIRQGQVTTRLTRADYDAGRKAWVREFTACANSELSDLRVRVPRLTGALRRSAFATAAASWQSAFIGFNARFAPYVKFKRPIKGKRRIDAVLNAWDKTLAGKSCRRKAREKADETLDRRHRQRQAANINTRRIRGGLRATGRALDAFTRYTFAFGQGLRIIVKATRFALYRLGSGIGI